MPLLRFFFDVQAPLPPGKYMARGDADCPPVRFSPHIFALNYGNVGGTRRSFPF